MIEAEEARALEVVKCLALLRSFGEAQQDADVRWKQNINQSSWQILSKNSKSENEIVPGLLENLVLVRIVADVETKVVSF